MTRQVLCKNEIHDAILYQEFTCIFQGFNLLIQTLIDVWPEKDDYIVFVVVSRFSKYTLVVIVSTFGCLRKSGIFVYCVFQDF